MTLDAKMPLAVVCAYALPDESRIEACPQRDGSTLWAVRRAGYCLTTEGFLEIEPQPSNRDSEFLLRCRFASAEAAYNAWRNPPTDRE